jgi:Flp pilus assembly pilin Flp
MKTLVKFAACDAGATAIEYSLIAALIAIGIITAVQGVGDVDTGGRAQETSLNLPSSSGRTDRQDILDPK